MDVRGQSTTKNNQATTRLHGRYAIAPNSLSTWPLLPRLCIGPVHGAHPQLYPARRHRRPPRLVF